MSAARRESDATRAAAASVPVAAPPPPPPGAGAAVATPVLPLRWRDIDWAAVLAREASAAGAAAAHVRGLADALSGGGGGDGGMHNRMRGGGGGGGGACGSAVPDVVPFYYMRSGLVRKDLLPR